MTESGAGWFDALVKLGAEGAEIVKKKLVQEIKDLEQAGKTLKSAASDLGEVARGEKDMEQFVATYKPKIQGQIRKDLGPLWCRLIYDDNAVLPALNTYYKHLPPPLPWFVEQEAFVAFCLKHRDTLLGERALRIDELRAQVAALSEPESERQALAARVAESRGVAQGDVRVAQEVDLAVRYVKSVPEILQSTATAAVESKRYDAVFPVLAELEFHFLDAAEDAPTDLPALLATSYLALTLIQTLSDKSIEREMPPLIDVDLRPANARMAKIVGLATKDIDAKVEGIVKDSEFMERVGKVAGEAVPVFAVAAKIAAFTSAIAGAGGGGGDGGGSEASCGGSEASCGGGGGGGSRPSATDRALSDAYTGALFGAECVGGY